MGQGIQEKVWRVTWHLPIKPKIKNFIWRCYNNCLSTADNLRHRGIKVDEVCCWCGEKDENLEHLMFQCDRAKRVWKLAGLFWEGLQVESIDFRAWWNDICHLQKGDNSQDRATLSTYIMWWLWKTRNNWLFNKEQCEERMLVKRAQSEWMEYEDTQVGRKIEKGTTSDSKINTNSKVHQGVGVQISVSSANDVQRIEDHGTGRVWKSSEMIRGGDGSRNTCKCSVESNLTQLRSWLLECEEREKQQVFIKVQDPNLRKWLRDRVIFNASFTMLLEDIFQLLSEFQLYSFVDTL
ncbi:Unknown protein [Striga hermonthica]|uniref:Reverse transcriptase zinc-binding domain-containing protein n=1 Tax=Striga hermonthica TaxID=68872 RepID=A0A9N7R4B4_STRHE|nr:Unknown protein [Striga hermonthica]